MMRILSCWAWAPPGQSPLGAVPRLNMADQSLLQSYRNQTRA